MSRASLCRSLWAAALLLVGCRTVAPTPVALIDALKTEPNSYLSGQPLGFANQQILNREDFAYDARLSRDGSLAAVSRLGMKSYFLTGFAVKSPVAKRFDVAVNAYEFDVESLEFLPDNSGVVTVSRDGALRVYNAENGALMGAWLGEEPLASVAVSPDGKWVAAGSVRGLVTVLAWPGLAFIAESRAHSDEVRALVFAADGRLFSGSWDRSISVHTLTSAGDAALTARLHTEVKNGLKSIRAVVDDKASGVSIVDARLPVVVVKTAMLAALGIDVSAVSETLKLPAPAGTQLAPVVHNRSLTLKGLKLTGLDIAVCDVCVPADVQVALGQQVLDRVEIANDEASRELVVTAKPNAAVVSTAQLVMSRVARQQFNASVNDLSLSNDDAVLGVAFSAAKGERTREVYEREKRKEVEPLNEWNVGARVDAKSLEVLEKYAGHHGVVATAGITPDGKHLLTGGWDKQLLLHGAPEARVPDAFGWALRKVRVSRDGRYAIVSAWTPQNAVGDHQSDPSAVIYELVYGPDALVKH